MHAARHAPRGGIERALLAELIDEGLSIRGIGERLNLSYATVRHWLRKARARDQARRTPQSRRLRSL
jgi:transposase